MATIGFIGAGHMGSQIARRAVATGHTVVMSNSRGPESLAPLEAATAGDIVIDTNNYYPQRDGQIPELDNESTTVLSCCRRICAAPKS